MLKDLSLRKSSSYQHTAQKIIIGIAGGSAAGKTTLCQNITRQMAFDRNFKAQVISLDCFYKSINIQTIDVRKYNFDHPDALDFDAAYMTLLALKIGKQQVKIPQYSFTQYRTIDTVTYASNSNIIFFQGLMAFYDKRIRDLMTYKIFIYCDDDIRLCRRLKRDTAERGRTVISVLQQYNLFVKKAYRDFIQPSINYADLIIPGFRSNRVSVDFIVQHIKNIAKHMNFKEHAAKTQIYCFGENQFYDLEYKDSHTSGPIEIEHSSFLIFPSSEEHRDELKFFLFDRLLSKSFRYEYFMEIMICQFSKVLKALFNQLIQLKNYDKDRIELYSMYNLNELFASQTHQRSIKAIFIPAAINIDTRNFLSLLRDYLKKYPQKELVLLNIFGHIDFPSMIYRLQMKATILINLFLITNQKRFSETMINNAQFTDHSFSWLICNRSLTQTVVQNLCDSLKIERGVNPEALMTSYRKAVDSQQKANQEANKQTAQILIEPITVGRLTQLPMYPQEHHNLCGYHVLNAIMNEASNDNLLSKEIFVENYYRLKQLLIPLYNLKNYLSVSDYEPLERKDLEVIIHPLDNDAQNELFTEKRICCIYYGFGYIQNSKQSLKDLDQSFQELSKGLIPQLLVVMGVVDHYFLVKLKDNKIYFMDSLNTPLQQLMKLDVSNNKNLTPTYKRKRGMRQALDIVSQLYFENRSVDTVAAQLKIHEILDSYFQIDGTDKKEQERWFNEQYPPSVIRNDLYLSLSHKIVKEIKPQCREMLERWQRNEFVRSKMGDQATFTL